MYLIGFIVFQANKSLDLLKNCWEDYFEKNKFDDWLSNYDENESSDFKNYSINSKERDLLSNFAMDKLSEKGIEQESFLFFVYQNSDDNICISIEMKSIIKVFSRKVSKYRSKTIKDLILELKSKYKVIGFEKRKFLYLSSSLRTFCDLPE